MKPIIRRIATAGVTALLLAACGGTTDTPPAVAEPSVEQPAQQPAEDAEYTTERPEGFPTEMPLPDGGYYTMRLSDATMQFEGNPSGIAYIFEWNRPFRELQDEMETLLADNGWTIGETQTYLAAEDDVAWRTTGHDMEVGIEIGPNDGDSDTGYILYVVFD